MGAGAAYRDGWYWSADGLRLHYRDWPGRDDRPTLLCIPGLTRSAADFDALAARMAGRRRLIAVDLRGRGESAWPRDSLTYMPFTYLLDLGRLLEAAGVHRFVSIGNSVGGLLAMQMTTGHRTAMAGVVLGDIGPGFEADGMARLRANVGRTASWATWVHAARDLMERSAHVYPNWALMDWLAHAHRICRISATGRVVFDHDPRIAEPLRLPGRDAGTDLWAAFEQLAGMPVLSLRGALSDVLSAAGQAEMQRRLPGIMMAEVPHVGHAPTLAEPVAAAALDRLLAAVDARSQV